ncbi:MAG TPA: hypothetical protein VFP47_14435 [Pyrinomonadaceae bacterium]|nr:hypothetical protein [Pyrinomonadaceae bacterium]
MGIEIVGIAGGVGAIIGALFMTGRAVRVMWKFLRRTGHALDIIIGVPAIGESPERPGVVKRLDMLEEKTQSIAKEVRPNGGSSLRDTVESTKVMVKRVEESLSAKIESTIRDHESLHHRKQR